MTGTTQQVTGVTVMTNDTEVLAAGDVDADGGQDPGPRRVHHRFEATRRAAGGRTAVVVSGRSVTYAELDDLADDLAQHLQALGVGPGSRCGIRLNRSVHLYVAILATLKAGAAFVPIEPTAPPQRLQHIVEDADLAVLLTTSDLASTVTPGAACVVKHLDVADDVLRAAVAGARPLATVTADERDPACYVMYTSGAGGPPKGVEVLHSTVCHLLDVVPQMYGITADDRVYQGMTIAFDFALEEIWPAWSVGAAVVAGPPDHQAVGTALSEFLRASEVTVLCSVPTVLAMTDPDVPSVRLLVLGGEPCPDELVKRWSAPGRRILNTYGPTEATVTATCGELRPQARVTIGRPLHGCGVHVLDADLAEVAVGTVGEICISGLGLARGYLGAPELTSRRFVTPRMPGIERVYRTGDLGRVLPDGDLEFLGRADGQVTVHGHRVRLDEIESVVMEEDDVRAAVSAVVHIGSTPALAAYVVVGCPPSEVGPTRVRLEARLRTRLSPYAVPEFLDVVPELPMLPNGKVDRASLPQPLHRMSFAGSAYAPPRSAAEVRMTAVWARVLGVPLNGVSLDADFFLDLGGNSWLAATVVAALRRSGVAASVSVADLYAHPTVRALAGRPAVHLGTPASLSRSM